MASVGNVPKGAALVGMATLVFAATDVLTKQLTTVHGVVLVVALRYLVNLAVLGAVLGPRHGAAIWTTQRGVLVFLRGMCLVVASVTMGLALMAMPVAETVAIVYIAPVLVVFFGWLLLKEAVTLPGWIGAVIGFGGVVLIVRPGSGLDPTGVIFCLVNAVSATCYHLLTRVLAKTESMAAMLFHTALVGTVAFWGVLLFQGLPEVMPGARDLVLMGLLGVLAAGAHALFTAAYREAPASTLAPINYLHLVWAAILGWIIFAHVPDHWTVLGMVLVAGSGIVVALYSAGSARAQSNP